MQLRRVSSVTQEQRGQGERRASVPHGKPLRVVGWQFQLDGIVEVPLGVHGCSVMEDYYSWSLRRLMSESSVSPWHAWAPFRSYSSVLLQCGACANAALQTCRAVKGRRKQSTAGVQWQITMGRARSLLVGGCVRQYHEQTVVRCRQADTSPVRFEPQMSDTSKAANSSGLRVSRRCRFVSGCSEISVYVMSYTWKARCVRKMWSRAVR